MPTATLSRPSCRCGHRTPLRLISLHSHLTATARTRRAPIVSPVVQLQRHHAPHILASLSSLSSSTLSPTPPPPPAVTRHSHPHPIAPPPMVLIHVTRGTEELVYETKTSESVDSVTHAIASLHNRRLQVRRLVGGVRELAKYGPQKEEQQRGLSEEQINALGKESKEVEGADPLGLRIGQGRHSRSSLSAGQCQPPPPSIAMRLTSTGRCCDPRCAQLPLLSCRRR